MTTDREEQIEYLAGRILIPLIRPRMNLEFNRQLQGAELKAFYKAWDAKKVPTPKEYREKYRKRLERLSAAKLKKLAGDAREEDEECAKRALKKGDKWDYGQVVAWVLFQSLEIVGHLARQADKGGRDYLPQSDIQDALAACERLLKHVEEPTFAAGEQALSEALQNRGVIATAREGGPPGAMKEIDSNDIPAGKFWYSPEWECWVFDRDGIKLLAWRPVLFDPRAVRERWPRDSLPRSKTGPDANYSAHKKILEDRVARNAANLESWNAESKAISKEANRQHRPDDTWRPLSPSRIRDMLRDVFEESGGKIKAPHKP